MRNNDNQWQGSTIDWATWRWSPNTQVVDVNGAKVGALVGAHPDLGYILVRHGWFFNKQEWYVPLGAVSRMDDRHQIVLRYTKDEIDHQLWAEPPQRTTSADTLTNTNIAATPATNMAQEQAEVVSAAPPNQRITATEDQVGQVTAVPLREEELVPEKRNVEEGVVHVHKTVTEQPETVSAPVAHEEVIVDRVPAASTANAQASDAFQDQSFDVTVMGEQLVAEKQARVRDDVRLRKETVTENEQVTDTVRRENLTLQDDNDTVIPLDGTHDTDLNAQA